MKGHSQRARRIVIALTALCTVWLLSGQIVSMPAFAEGSGSVPFPGEGISADTTIITRTAVIPNSEMAASDVIEVVVLFFGAVL